MARKGHDDSGQAGEKIAPTAIATEAYMATANGPLEAGSPVLTPERKKGKRESYYLVMSIKMDGEPDSVLAKVTTWRRAKSYIFANRLLLRRLGLNCVITRARNVETCLTAV